MVIGVCEAVYGRAPSSTAVGGGVGPLRRHEDMVYLARARTGVSFFRTDSFEIVRACFPRMFPGCAFGPEVSGYCPELVCLHHLGEAGAAFIAVVVYTPSAAESRHVPGYSAVEVTTQNDA